MRAAKLGGVIGLLVLSSACSTPGEPADTAAATETEPDSMAMTEDAHSSRNSLDWAGTYSGILPCADCPGIETTVTLHADGRYERRMVYLERSVAPLTDAGSFSWNAAGSAVTLHEAGGEGGQQFKVGENTLIHLDQEGRPITGELARHYVLHKHLQDPAIEGKRWRLVELRGRPVEAGKGAFLVLDPERGLASGNASCNSFSGAYAIKSGNRISLGDMAVTMMACPDMAIEEQFLDVLRRADNYTVADGVLSLNRARMAPLARFEVAGD
ncbi:MAG TPA: copper resistance protein NlpE N-terminal domain-containing protein [Woeseiaceae bacterium]|nr:copper resistance protein NlpE N-terminal domain-containing protein [Woeseiaceae bacterium]